MSLRKLLTECFDTDLSLKARLKRNGLLLLILIVVILLVHITIGMAIPFVRFERSPYWDQIQPGTWVITEYTFITDSGIRSARYGKIRNVRYDTNGLVLRKIISIDISETRYLGPNGEIYVSATEVPVTAECRYRDSQMIIMGQEENPELHVINHDAYRKLSEYYDNESQD
jgi:hypothetical protein